MQNLPENFRHVRLLLAREQGHPDGEADHGYDILMPLTPDGHIDGDVATAHKANCRVRRFRPGEADAIGVLARGPGGHWAVDYPGTGSHNDEPAFRFEDEKFEQGEYVSIREDDGEMHTFRVAQVGAI